MSLKKKTISGLIWSFISQGGKQLSQFIITAILARLLSPNDFGLLAIATIFTNFAMIFGEMGISSALIQKQNTHDRHFYSAFWLNIVVGVFLTIVIIIVSSPIALFYARPELKSILMMLSLNFFISSFVIIQQTVLTKALDFKKLALRDLGAVIISGIVGIVLAYKNLGVWSLVYQSLIFSIVNAVLLWVLSPWRPKFIFSFDDIKDLFNFSVHLTGFNIVNYFSRNIDQLLIGKFLGTQALGYYSLAYKIMLFPLQNLSWIISKVIFPVFSKIQNDLIKLSEVYMRIVKAISLITFPAIFVAYIFASEIIQLAYGAKWAVSAVLFKTLCLAGFMQSVGTTVGNVYLSLGRSDLQFKMGIANSLLTIIFVSFGLRYNLFGVALFYSVFSFLWVHFSFYIVTRMLKVRYQAFYVKSFLTSYILAITLAILAYFLRNLLVLDEFYKILVSLIIIIIFYLIFLLKFKVISFRKIGFQVNI